MEKSSEILTSYDFETKKIPFEVEAKDNFNKTNKYFKI